MNISCCLLQTLLSLTILADSFVCNLQKTINIVLVLGLFIQSDYLSINEIMLTALFWFPIFYSTPLLNLLQTVVSYPESHSLVIYVASTHYFWTTLLNFLLTSPLLLPQNELSWITYSTLLRLYLSLLLMVTSW